MVFCQEIIEHILQYADGETLLTCREVSPVFAAAVKYLARTKNIWEELYAKEKGEYPFSIISKLHPHMEGLNHPKNWGVIYETCLLRNFIANNKQLHVCELKIGREYSEIEDVETHEDLILVLVKYNKNFSIFYKIVTLNLENRLIGKSCRFYANMLYVTPMDDPSKIRADAILLPCKFCHLAAVPIYGNEAVLGFPKFYQDDDFLKVEHSNGEVFWLNNFGKLLTKGRSFHTGINAKHKELKRKALNCVKIFQGFNSLSISCGQTRREFNTFKSLRAFVTASLYYSNLLFLGTDTGMLYVYNFGSESDLKLLNLESYIQHYNVCPNSILVINAMELRNQFVIICSSEKSLYHIHIKREFKNFN